MREGSTDISYFAKTNAFSVCYFQAQKLLLRDGTLANFTIQSPSALPTITLGLPANTKVNTELISLK